MTTHTSKNKAISFDTATSLTILVGKGTSQKSFLAHESVLCARSEFFRRAMTGNRAEREDRTVKLPEGKPETFPLYMNIVYTNIVATSPDESPHSPPERTAEYVELCELYVLSEKLRDKLAKSAVLMAMRTINRDDDIDKSVNRTGLAMDPDHFNPNTAAIAIMYDGTLEGSLGRKLMADLWSNVPGKYLAENADKLVKDFIQDLALILLKDQASKKSVALRAKVSVYEEA